MNTSHFRWVSNPAIQIVGKRLSLGFAVVSTVGDANFVWDHGNPIGAFEREGADYAADVARLGFSGSTAAFLVAPNPVAGGIVTVTGVVWAGAEVVDHWDEIVEGWDAGYEGFERGAEAIHNSTSDIFRSGWNWTSDRWDEALNWSDDRLDDATDWTGDRIDDLADIGSGRLDAGTDAFDFTKSQFAR